MCNSRSNRLINTETHQNKCYKKNDKNGQTHKHNLHHDFSGSNNLSNESDTISSSVPHTTNTTPTTPTTSTTTTTTTTTSTTTTTTSTTTTSTTTTTTSTTTDNNNNNNNNDIHTNDRIQLHSNAETDPTPKLNIDQITIPHLKAEFDDSKHNINRVNNNQTKHITTRKNALENTKYINYANTTDIIHGKGNNSNATKVCRDTHKRKKTNALSDTTTKNNVLMYQRCLGTDVHNISSDVEWMNVYNNGNNSYTHPHRILDAKQMLSHHTRHYCIFTINAYEYNRIVNTLCIMIGNNQGVIEIKVEPTSNKRRSVITFIAVAHNGARTSIKINSHQLCPNNRLIRPVQKAFQIKVLLTYIKMCTISPHMLVTLHVSPCGLLIESSDKVQCHLFKVYLPDVSNIDFNSYY